MHVAAIYLHLLILKRTCNLEKRNNYYICYISKNKLHWFVASGGYSCTCWFSLCSFINNVVTICVYQIDKQ